VELIPRSELTTEQIRAVELPPDEHRVLIGGPGSGKTQVLLHRADYLRRTQNIDEDGYYILVFTRALKQYLRSACNLLDLDEGSIDTLDKWCFTYYRRHISNDLPQNRETNMVHFARIRTEVREHLERRPGPPPYDFILVDEGQDLTAEAFDLIKLIGRHVTVCIDHKQQIYEHGSRESDILRRLGLKRHNMSLLATYRCTPYIVDIASRLVPDPDQRREFVNQCRINGSGREQPLMYVAKDFEDEQKRLAEILRVRLGKGERVAVLVPRKNQMFGFAKGLTELGFEVETKRDLDFTTNRPKVLTFQSAKGLTFDSVLMPRLVNTSFTRESSELIDRLLFVGITRAMNWVYLSSTDPYTLPVLGTIWGAADNGSLAIQNDGVAIPVGHATPPTKNDPPPDDDLTGLL